MHDGANRLYVALSSGTCANVLSDFLAPGANSSTWAKPMQECPRCRSATPSRPCAPHQTFDGRAVLGCARRDATRRSKVPADRVSHSRLMQRPAHPVSFPGLVSPEELRESGKSRNRGGMGGFHPTSPVVRRRPVAQCHKPTSSTSCFHGRPPHAGRVLAKIPRRIPWRNDVAYQWTPRSASRGSAGGCYSGSPALRRPSKKCLPSFAHLNAMSRLCVPVIV
jgi:hypothetical protein